MATDYDSPRKTEDEIGEDSIEDLKVRHAELGAHSVDLDESELAESLELPGADLSAIELEVQVIPKQRDEFTCTSCFLVHHISQLVEHNGSEMICAECA